MAVPIKDIVERVARSRGIEPVELLVRLIGLLSFGSNYVNISPKGEVKDVGTIANQLAELMRITQSTEAPPSIYAAVELTAEFWVRFDRRRIEEEEATGTNRFPKEQLNEHEALLLILREARNELERATIAHTLKTEEWMKQHGVPPFFENPPPEE